MKNFLAVSFIILAGIIYLLPGCDTAQADPYREKYEQQVAVTDSMQGVIDEMANVGSIMEQMYNASINKIDSLKNENQGIKQQLLACEQNLAVIDSIHNANVNVMLQSIQTALENLSAEGLQYLININNR